MTPLVVLGHGLVLKKIDGSILSHFSIKVSGATRDIMECLQLAPLKSRNSWKALN